MSVRYTAADVAQWCGGEVVSGSPDTKLLGLAIDTREVTPGCLFAAIVGPNHDAHKFLAQAKDAGASGLLMQTGSDVDLTAFADIAVIAVADTTKGIGDLATGHRGRFAGTVIALTGSCGKTTTKEMISAVLETAGPCLKTQGNLNNNFGVPLTLLSRRPEDVRAVVEMGMNHRGEIAVLANIGLPDIGLVTNVGTAHIEYLGSQEEIAAEKGDLFAALGADGTAVANWDDPHVRAQSDRAAGRVTSFGVNPDADVRAENTRFEEDGAYHFTLLTPKGEAQVRIKALGDTTVINALAAAAVGIACDLSVETIAAGLGNYAGIAGRMSRHTLAGGVSLIDDTYNANPQSMGAAISSLASLAAKGRGIAILGGMGELGANAPQAHRDAGKQVFEAGAALLVTVGDAAQGIAQGAAEAGMAAAQIHRCDTHEEAARAVQPTLASGDWILVKGSRAARMERVVEELLNTNKHGQNDGVSN
ncbi:MAG: UDP-N-acetylmuramoyl-tripeptide--D-alanyl-D-alanine ligase [Myxococcota bacterium]|nr:UDP-N-acetylmuramoyl-tripeptide--D-alanyl-D-alanine ligase [Myxococcota bacterium]